MPSLSCQNKRKNERKKREKKGKLRKREPQTAFILLFLEAMSTFGLIRFDKTSTVWGKYGIDAVNSLLGAASGQAMESK